MRSHGARCAVCLAGEFTASSDIILVNRRADQAANLTTIEEEHPETARLRPTTRGFRCLTVSHHVRGLIYTTRAIQHDHQVYHMSSNCHALLRSRETDHRTLCVHCSHHRAR